MRTHSRHDCTAPHVDQRGDAEEWRPNRVSSIQQRQLKSHDVPELFWNMFWNMFQNMIGRMRLGAPRPCGITPFASGVSAAYRPGDGHCKRCACRSCISPKHVRRCVRARRLGTHTWATAGCSSCQSQLQSTLLMTVTVTIHSSLKNTPPSPSQRVTLNYAPQTLSSAIPEPCKAPNIGEAG